jgi:hypothetical protein
MKRATRSLTANFSSLSSSANGIVIRAHALHEGVHAYLLNIDDQT